MKAKELNEKITKGEIKDGDTILLNEKEYNEFLKSLESYCPSHVYNIRLSHHYENPKNNNTYSTWEFTEPGIGVTIKLDETQESK